MTEVSTGRVGPLEQADDTRAWGRRLGKLLRAGDLVILTGELGAGKTTLTQGIADGLGVRGPVTSPTFVIARVHPATPTGVPLVHVDAYRLGGGSCQDDVDVAAEVDALDLDASLAESVTVVEWGRGVAEDLAEESLEVVLAGQGARTITLRARGRRWAQVIADLEQAPDPS